MEGTNGFGMDVCNDTISIAVRNSFGDRVMERIVETKVMRFLSLCMDCLGACI